jgi:hypothetical protein
MADACERCYTRARFSSLLLPKIAFAHQESRRVVELLDEAAQRSGVSRGQVFEDLLHMGVCALSGGRMEEQYLAAVQKHTKGLKGMRGCDSIVQAFGTLVAIMERTRSDILGDIFQGAITYGEGGQYFTPESLCELMARITLEAADGTAAECMTIADPCCGSGRLLLAAANVRPDCELVGQDIDLRCVRMTALNLALHNRYAHVIWGNSLANEQKLVYRTGFDGRGFVRELPLAECAAPVKQVAEAHELAQSDAADQATPAREEPDQQRSQLYLF